MGCHILKLKAPGHKKVACDRLGFVSSLQKGRWIVRFVQGSVVDHSVEIDGEQKVTYDSAETYPLQLCMEVLGQYDGGTAKEIQVGEVTQVYPNK